MIAVFNRFEMHKHLAVFIVVFTICTAANAEVYKCIGSDGKESYSNLPCPDGSSKKQLENLGTYTNESDQSYEGEIVYEQNIEELSPVSNSNTPSVLHISDGEQVSLYNHMEYGKYTAFLFYAPWCPSCKKARPIVQQSANSNENLVLREINIVNWESPVKDQYRIPSIPYFKLFDPKGKLISEGSGAGSQTYNLILNPDSIN